MSRDINEHASEDFGITLPIRREDFRDFISSLLGKPQTISKRIKGPFDLGKGDIENFFHLVVQRVRQQNDATLVQFTVELIYDDNSTVLLNSLEDFLNYNEVRPVVSEAVHLSWIFLLRFQDKTTYERQQIDVSIVTEHTMSLSLEEFHGPIFSAIHQLKGFIGFRISHTARTWGADIEALLTGHINNIKKPIHPVKKFIREHDAWIGLGVGGFFLLASILSSFYTTQRMLRSHTESAKHLQGIGGDLNSKIDYLVSISASGMWERYFFYASSFILIAFILSIVFGIWAGISADINEPSFLLLTRQSERRKEKQLAKNKRNWRTFALSIGLSIVTGVIGNMLFAWLLEKWHS